MGEAQSLASLRCWDTGGCRTWSQAVLSALSGRICLKHFAKPGSSITLLGVGGCPASRGHQFRTGVCSAGGFPSSLRI